MDIFEILKNAGITVPDEKKDELDKALRKTYKHKSEIDAIGMQLEQAKEQLQAANAEIEKFRGLDIDGIKKAADEWKIKAEKAETDAQAELNKLKLDYALETALLKAKTKDTTATRALKALIDHSVLKMDKDGTVKGLQEQIDSIKNESPYLFQEEAPVQSQEQHTKVDFGKPNSGETPKASDPNTLMNDLFRNKGE